MKNEKYTIETEDASHHILTAHGEFVRYFSTLAEAQEYAKRGDIDTVERERKTGFNTGIA